MTIDQITKLTECGRAQMPLDDAVIIAGVTEDEFARDRAAQDAYRKGQLETKLAMNMATIELAKTGNPALLKMYYDRIDRETIGEIEIETGEEEEDKPKRRKQ